MDDQSKDIDYSYQLKKVMYQIISAAIKHRKIVDYLLQDTGVYSAQHQILMELSRNQFASQKEIADKMNVSSATIAVSLKKLEKGGYISKEIDDADNRLNQITLTDKGKYVVEQSRKIFKSTDLRVFDGFDQKELEELSRLLAKLNKNLEIIDNSIKR
jgi:DNA-binding MarR family transcriptional regulator